MTRDLVVHHGGLVAEFADLGGQLGGDYISGVKGYLGFHAHQGHQDGVDTCMYMAGGDDYGGDYGRVCEGDYVGDYGRDYVGDYVRDYERDYVGDYGRNYGRD